MNVTPFIMGSNTSPYDYESRTTTANWGLQLSLALPLDGGMIEQCKQIAKNHDDKMQLDYELTRALKCSEIQKNGFMLRPGSRVAHMCSDVVPIVTYEKESNGRPVQRITQPRYKEFLSRIKTGEASTQDLKQLVIGSKLNDISGVEVDGSPLNKLAKLVPQVDPEMVQQRLYGKKP